MLTVKEVKAKLYNFRSGVDGLIPMVEAGVLGPECVGNAVASLASSFCDQCNKAMGRTSGEPVEDPFG